MKNQLKIMAFLTFFGSIAISTAQTNGCYLRFVNELGQSVNKNLRIVAYDAFAIGYDTKLVKDTANGHYNTFFCKVPLSRIKVYDSSGNYRFLDTIFKSFLPNETKTIKLSFNFNNFMDDIVISVDKSATKIKESPVSLTVVKPYLLQNKISNALNDVIDQIPGVSYTDQQVNIRSGSGWSYGAGSRVMVMVDELPMLSGDANAVQWSFLPIENLESIEVIKSAGSVLFGSGALNGAINLKTADAKTTHEGRFTLFSSIYGKPANDSWAFQQKTNFSHGSNGFYSQKIKNTGFVLGYNALWDDGYRLNEINHRIRLNFKIKHTLGKNPNIIYGLNGGVQRGKTGSFLLWESNKLPYTSLDSGFSNSKQWRVNIDPFFEFKTKKINHKILGRYLLTDNLVETQDTSINQSNSGIATYLEYKLATEFKKILITTGVVGQYNRTNSPLFSGFQTSKNASIYMQLQRRIGRLIATAGGRYENFWLNNNYFNKPVFRTGVNYALKKFTYVRASAGQGYRFPSMAEAFISTSAGPVKVYPNPNLRPESGNNYEIGIKQGYKIGKFKGYFDASVFQIKIKDMMEFTFAQWSSNLFPPNFGFGFKSVNSGSGKVNGFELETAGEGDFGKINVKILTGYTFTNPINTSNSLVYANDSTPDKKPMTFLNTRSDSVNYLKYRTKHQFKWDVQFTYGKFEFGISLKLSSKIENIDKAFQDFPMSFIIPGIKQSRLDYPYTKIIDLRIASNISEKIKINFQIQNLFNSVSLGRPADMRPPRTAQLQLVYKI